MAPDGRRKRLNRFKAKKNGFGWFKYTALFLAVLILGLVLAFQTMFWDGKAKVASAMATQKGDIVVSVFDLRFQDSWEYLGPKASGSLEKTRALAENFWPKP